MLSLCSGLQVKIDMLDTIILSYNTTFHIIIIGNSSPCENASELRSELTFPQQRFQFTPADSIKALLMS